jgi:hypothetical protein
MSIPRRQLIRPTPPPNDHAERDRLLHKLRGRLETERTSFARWMRRLKRSFHSVEKIEGRISRIEKTLARLEE